MWWAQSSDETLADPPSWLNVIEVPDNGRIDWGMIVRSGTPVVLRSAASSWQIVQNSNRSGFLETILQRVILSDVHTMRVKPSAHALFVNHDHQARSLCTVWFFARFETYTSWALLQNQETAGFSRASRAHRNSPHAFRRVYERLSWDVNHARGQVITMLLGRVSSRNAFVICTDTHSRLSANF